MQLFIEVTSILAGGLLGATSGAHFKEGKVEPILTRIWTSIAAFIIVWFMLGDKSLEFGRKAFALAAAIAFCIEILGQHKISKMIAELVNHHFRKVVPSRRWNDDKKE